MHTFQPSKNCRNVFFQMCHKPHGFLFCCMNGVIVCMSWQNVQGNNTWSILIFFDTFLSSNSYAVVPSHLSSKLFWNIILIWHCQRCRFEILICKELINFCYVYMFSQSYFIVCLYWSEHHDQKFCVPYLINCIVQTFSNIVWQVLQIQEFWVSMSEWPNSLILINSRSSSTLAELSQK